MILAYILIGFVGACMGSFMSVLVSRLDNEKGILMGRSKCPDCSIVLKWYDLAPVFSYLILGGKCRHCGKKISIIYPIMELVVAGSFVGYFYINGLYFTIESLYSLVIIFILLSLTFFDIRYLILPDKLIIAGLITAGFYVVLYGGNFPGVELLTGLGLSVFFGTIFIVSHGEWIGFGDVKLVFLIGLILGYPLALFSVIGSVWSGALAGIYLMLVGKAGLKTALPFGSFICGMAVVSLIFKDFFYYIYYGL